MPAPGAQFELAVTVTEQPDGSLRGHTVHAAELFEGSTIAGLRDDLVAVLDAATGDGEHPLSLPTGAGVSPERIARLLREHPSVADATVRVEPAAGPDAKLTAELTPATTSEPVPDGVLRSFLSAELPGTAIPSEYRWITVPAPFELVSLTNPAPAAFIGPRDDVEANWLPSGAR